jgi:hypothetical protein
VDEPALRGGWYVAALAAYTLVGALLGVVGAFLTPAGPWIGPVLLSLGVPLGLLAMPALVVVACRLCGRSMAGIAPYAGWLAVTAALSLNHHGEEPVLPGNAYEAVVFVFGGATVGAVVVGLGPLWVGPFRRRTTPEVAGDPAGPDPQRADSVTPA